MNEGLDLRGPRRMTGPSGSARLPVGGFPFGIGAQILVIELADASLGNAQLLSGFPGCAFPLAEALQKLTDSGGRFSANQLLVLFFIG